MWFSLKDIREMSDQDIKSKYYAMINESRHEFNEKQKIQRFLESPLLMCCFMVLWLMMAFILFIFYLDCSNRRASAIFILWYTVNHPALNYSTL